MLNFRYLRDALNPLLLLAVCIFQLLRFSALDSSPVVYNNINVDKYIHKKFLSNISTSVPILYDYDLGVV